MIKCYSCKEVKETLAFFRDSSNNRGFAAYCKVCVKAKRDNPKDRAKARQRTRKWLQNTANLEKHKAYQAQWFNDNPHKRAQYSAVYKARCMANGPVDDTINVFDLSERDSGICGICKKFIEQFHEKSIDHVLPVSRGGTHTWDNVQLAHRICNSVKNNKTMEELGVPSN